MNFDDSYQWATRVANAAERGDVDLLRTFIDDRYPDEAKRQDCLDYFLLLSADQTRKAYEECADESQIALRIRRMKTTLEAGADPNAKDSLGHTALHIIAGAPLDKGWRLEPA